MSTLRTLRITSITGVMLTVIDIPAGKYAGFPAAKSHLRQIEFYDTRFSHTIFGQFTGGRYHVTDFVQPGRNDRVGLALDGVNREWTIDADEVGRVKAWLKGN